MVVSAARGCGRVVVNMASTVLLEPLVMHRAGERISWSFCGMSVFAAGYAQTRSGPGSRAQRVLCQSCS